jgi:hypothetical protein
MMHVVDTVLDSFSNLFRSHRYFPLERIYSVFLFTAGLSLKLKCLEELVTVISGLRKGGDTNLTVPVAKNFWSF